MEKLIEMKCESCSSTEFKREGDYLVCEYCESKYYSPKPKKEAPREASRPKETISYNIGTTKGKKNTKGRLVRRIVIVILLLFVFIPTCAVILEDEFDDSSSTTRFDVNVGDTVDAGAWKATVGAPNKTVIVPGSYREEFYVAAPISITASEDCVIKREDFSMTDSSYPDDALPKELNLKAGESFQGSLYLDWFYARDHRDNEDGLERGSFSNRIRYSNYEDKSNRISATWEADAPSMDAVEVNPATVLTQMPNTPIRFSATFKEAFLDSKYPEAVFTMKGEGNLPVAVTVNSSLKNQLAQIAPGDTVTLRGTLNALQARMSSTETIREVILVDASIEG